VVLVIKTLQTGIKDTEYPDSLGVDGSASENEFDLCSKCFISFSKMLDQNLRGEGRGEGEGEEEE
jgi:hypothetical protein